MKHFLFILLLLGFCITSHAETCGSDSLPQGACMAQGYICNVAYDMNITSGSPAAILNFHLMTDSTCTSLMYTSIKGTVTYIFFRKFL